MLKPVGKQRLNTYVINVCSINSIELCLPNNIVVDCANLKGGVKRHASINIKEPTLLPVLPERLGHTDGPTVGSRSDESKR